MLCLPREDCSTEFKLKLSWMEVKNHPKVKKLEVWKHDAQASGSVDETTNSKSQPGPIDSDEVMEGTLKHRLIEESEANKLNARDKIARQEAHQGWRWSPDCPTEVQQESTEAQKDDPFCQFCN